MKVLWTDSTKFHGTRCSTQQITCTSRILFTLRTCPSPARHTKSTEQQLWPSTINIIIKPNIPTERDERFTPFRVPRRWWGRRGARRRACGRGRRWEEMRDDWQRECTEAGWWWMSSFGRPTSRAVKASSRPRSSGDFGEDRQERGASGNEEWIGRGRRVGNVLGMATMMQFGMRGVLDTLRSEGFPPTHTSSPCVKIRVKYQTAPSCRAKNRLRFLSIWVSI